MLGPVVFAAVTDLIRREVARMRQVSTRSTGVWSRVWLQRSPLTSYYSTLGWQNRDTPPRMLVGIRASLLVVLDLTDPAHVRTLLDLEELLLEDWRKTNGEREESRSQALGRAVTDLAEGILTPSRSRNGKNLVI